MKKISIALLLAIMALTASAQRGGGMMSRMQNNPLMLLGRADVQADLGLTDDQKDKLSGYTDQQAMGQRFMSAMQESGVSFQEMRSEEGRKKLEPVMTKLFEQIQKEVEAIMTPAQSKRLKEISIQFYGFRSVNTPDVAKAIELTDAQKQKIADLRKAQGEAMQGLMERARNQEISWEEMREKSAKNDEILDAEIGKILTDAQKAKLKEMGGKKFERKDETV
jgi:Spy/CpxP family protein refolding chaperone